MLFFIFCIITPVHSTQVKTSVAIKQGIHDFSNPIATDTVNYYDFVQRSKLFIDTTQLIYDICSEYYDDTDAIIWLSPNKWGKSLNLDMLRTFFQMPVDNHGKEIVSKVNTKAYRLFVNGEIVLDNGLVQKLQTPLQISNHHKIINKHLGKHPILYISFKNATGNTFEEIVSKTRMAIAEGFKQHDYLISMYEKYETADIKTQSPLQRKNSDEEDPDEFSTSLAEKKDTITKLKAYINHQSHEESDEQERLGYLVKLLYDHYCKQVVVLFDDYDVPILHFLQNDTLSRNHLENLIVYIESIIAKTFDNSGNFYRGILVGTHDFTRAVHENDKMIFVANKNKPIHEYFGISRPNVKVLFQKTNINVTLSNLAQKWYNGYQSTVSNQAFYNPTSIAHFLSEKQITSYGEENGNSIYIRQVIERQPAIRATLLSLISRQTVNVIADSREQVYMDNAEMFRLKYALNNDTYNDNFFVYLTSEGYITKIASDAEKGKLANKETTFVISNWLISYYMQKYTIQEEPLQNTAIALRDFIRSDLNSTKSLELALETFYKGTSAKKCNVNDEEAVHSIFICLSLRMQGTTKFEINACYIAEPSTTSIVMIDNERSEAAAVAFHYHDPNPENAFKLAKEQKDTLTNFPGVNRIKFIGVNIAPNNTVQILTKADKI